MSDPTEIELKLEFDPEDRAKLDDAGTFADRGERARLVSAYFDTPDQDLREAGYTLRVRRKGDRHIQTVKAEAGAAAGLFQRPEWERPIEGDHPVLDAASSPLPRIIGRRTLARVAPLFTTDVERTTYALKHDGAAIELAIDQGEVRAGEARAPLCEIELELGDGPPGALFDLARRLNEDVPLRLGVRSKSERGYGLVDGKTRASVKAEPIPLDPESSPAEAFAAIARSCLRQFRLNEAILRECGGVEALHQARVGLRRLRSACSLFAPLLEGDEQATLLRDELRWLSSKLGDVRNLDVLAKRLEGPARERIGEARAEALTHALAALASAQARRLMIDLSEWLLLGGWRLAPADPALARQDVTAFAGDLLDRHRRKLKRRGRHLAALDDEARHKVRIEAKKLRYAVEFLSSLHTGRKARRRYKAFLGALEELQEQLGELNDLVTGPALLHQLGIDAALPAFAPEERRRLLDRAEDAYETLIDARRFWR